MCGRHYRRTGIPSRHNRTPVPWGPYRPLWPGMAIKAAPSAVISSGRTPADWDASMTSGTFRLRQMAAMSSMGRMKPNTVPYRDYIKNVASSEIYATWPESTIIANVLAIMSFTLNRVYTEWYRNKGFDFTITSSTAYDHFFVYGRNIYESISRVVDTIFANYLSRPNVRQPILTQYCDGKRVSCPNWMSQWGSMYLGDQGYTPIEIIRNYYGSDMYINSAELISGIPASWPGTDLTVGSTGSKVRQMQEQLDRISQTYPALPSVTPDGIYGESTRQAVEAFQRVFNLPVTGVVDYPTWYKISEIYVAVTRIAELN